MLLRLKSKARRHLRSAVVLLKLHKAIDVCGMYERRVRITGRDTGVTNREFGDYVMATVEDSSLDSRWEEYARA